jgi:hypothetical protein
MQATPEQAPTHVQLWRSIEHLGVQAWQGRRSVVWSWRSGTRHVGQPVQLRSISEALLASAPLTYAWQRASAYSSTHRARVWRLREELRCDETRQTKIRQLDGRRVRLRVVE